MKEFIAFLILIIFVLSGCVELVDRTKEYPIDEPLVKQKAQTGIIEPPLDKEINGYSEKKICPVCGRKFSDAIDYCPYDGAEVKPIGNNNNK